MMMAYFYEHTNGSIIEKPDIVVEASGGPHSYFQGPFVRVWWHESDLLRPVAFA